ncbi:hypothetical protein [Winogradskyella eximia]|uniref:hypothetical protein n=1 Tax=Winogradskyella eximia TaxID=262006 RepID=UPI00249271E6|nr:hypothetical protein [Winogradskyella eximia]
MATQKIPQHTTYVYKEINLGKYKSTRHYELFSLDKPLNKLSKLINVSKDRQCAKSSPLYWFKIKQGKKYSKWLTGLFKTEIPYIFEGDLDHKKHLILFHFKEDTNTLVIKYFEGYYTKDLRNLLPLFKN